MSLVPRWSLEETREFCEVMMRVSRNPEWSLLIRAIKESIKENDEILKAAARDRNVPFEKLAHITLQCTSWNSALEAVIDLPLDAHGALQGILKQVKGLDSTPGKTD